MKALANCILGCLLLVFGSAWAQNFPNKPIRLISTGGSGTPPDVLARILANKLNERTGWTMLVEPRTGDYAIPINAVMQSPADGQAMLLGVMSMTITASSKKDISYDFVRDLQPMVKVANIPGLIVATAGLPVSNFKELVAYSKANPGKLTFAGNKEGSHSHLLFELLRLKQGLDALYVPYNTQNSIGLEILSGRNQVGFSSLSDLIGNIQAGKLRPVMLIAPVRHPSVPDVPLATEITGDAGFATGSWFGVFIKSGAPKPITERVEKELTGMMQLPDTQAQIQKIGFTVAFQNSTQFAASVGADVKRWAQIIKDANIKIE